MSNKAITLFVFEGEKQESQYLSIFLKALSIDIQRIEIAFCTHIYTLHNKLKKDANLDTFELLKKKCISLQQQDYDRDSIARIYLFFDYDGHVSSANNEKIQEMLQIFDNETEAGKLFLSYPMLEALVDTAINFKDATTSIDLGKAYKRQKSIKLLPKDKTKKLTKKHLKKANYLVNGKYQIPNNFIEQGNIFTHQLNKHINPNKQVAVLSALPLFYLDYKGAGFVLKSL